MLRKTPDRTITRLAALLLLICLPVLASCDTTPSGSTASAQQESATKSLERIDARLAIIVPSETLIESRFVAEGKSDGAERFEAFVDDLIAELRESDAFTQISTFQDNGIGDTAALAGDYDLIFTIRPSSYEGGWTIAASGSPNSAFVRFNADLTHSRERLYDDI